MRKIFELITDTRKISVKKREKLTVGSVGIEAEFSFSEDWSGLGKTAVFETDRHKISVPLVHNRCTLPWELFDEAGYDVILGIYGTNRDGSMVIPTVYTKLGTIERGADPESADNAQRPTASDYQQILSLAQSLVLVADEIRNSHDNGDYDGRDGVDGFCPKAVVERTDRGVKISITDYEGTTTAEVYDGLSGEAGDTGAVTYIENPYDDTALRAEVNAKYTKPAGGIPAADLAPEVTALIPTKLPTPNRLSFTGAASGSFDGSAAVTVNIPAAGLPVSPLDWGAWSAAEQLAARERIGIAVLTQAEYDLIETKSESTVYIIVEETA